ncbi:MAG: type II toxin-antitoxin system HicB family antitoxin [Acidobacteriota bacterium]
MTNRYEIIIFWSDEDQAFIADVPELAGCMADGSSHAEALTNAQEAIALWLETAREHADSVPEAKGRRRLYVRSLLCAPPEVDARRQSPNAKTQPWPSPPLGCG